MAERCRGVVAKARVCHFVYNYVQEAFMAASTTMTIRISAEVRDKLERLAGDTRRSKSFLAGEAVEVYVERELEIIGAIHGGIADVEAGLVVPQDAAMDEIYAAIETAAGSKA